MRRRVFDMLVSIGGVLMVVVLVVAGALLMVGYNFANNNVHNQLAQQQIVFPPEAAFAHAKAGSEITPSMIPSVSQYAGQELTTGAQAQVYADDFIAVHLQEIGGGKTYCTTERSRHEPPQGFTGIHRSRSQGPDRLPGHDASRSAPRGLRLLRPR